MSDFDSSILKKNVRILIKNNGITQEKLGEIIGMSQSNVSKALNENSKKCFTVPQVYNIAEYFHVSIDWLVGGRSGTSISGHRSIAEYIASLLREGIAKCETVTVMEVEYRETRNGTSDIYSSGMDKNKYHAIYFPNYWDPRELAKDDFEYLELEDEARNIGNKTHNVALNLFLEKYLQILSVYKAGNLPEEAYQLILKEYLNQIPEA